MSEKRKFPRFCCKLKCKFNYFEGDPEKIDIHSVKSRKGKAGILDISRGGVFISTNTEVGINRPVIVTFKTNRKVYSLLGNIVRTGLVENNPAEVLEKFKQRKIKEKIYIAVEFEKPVEEFTEGEIG
ncbi:MAG: PilZ domain-containing protein [Spirochaetes bacterium]|nr:PilZ domain-containing protein [Spirochaetota bacterium]